MREAVKEADLQRVLKDLKKLSTDAEDVLEATAGQASEKITEMRERLTDALGLAKDTYNRLEKKTMATAKRADRTIRDNPYQSLGVALVVGLLVGFLSSRRS